MKRILLTNDDGFFASGITALEKVLDTKYEVFIVAPDRERSAVSHSLTLHNPLRIRKISDKKYITDGTPTDCILLALHNIILNIPPDLIISGINNGANMGEDVLYSGTVAAAIEGMNSGIPSIAVSLTSREKGSFEQAAKIVDFLLQNDLKSIIFPDTILNINIPPLSIKEIKGVKLTSLGHRKYSDFILERKDPHGESYYFIGGDPPKWFGNDKSDYSAIKQGYVSITPLKVDMTYKEIYAKIQPWFDKLRINSNIMPELDMPMA